MKSKDTRRQSTGQDRESKEQRYLVPACRSAEKEHWMYTAQVKTRAKTQESTAQVKTEELKGTDTKKHSTGQDRASEGQRHLVPAGAPSASSLAHSLSTVARRSVVATASALTAGSAELAWRWLLLCTSPSS